MSRYLLAPKEKKYEVCVGFDNPLQTYFAQVIDLSEVDENEEHKFKLWSGCSYEEVTDVEQLIESVKPFAIISDEVKSQLVEDFANRTRPSGLQELFRNMFKK